VALAPATSSGRKAPTQPTRYVVVYEQGVSKAAARAAIRAAGAELVRENAKVGVATVVTRNPSFITDAAKDAALFGAVKNRPLGRVKPQLRPKADVDLRAVRRLLKGNKRGATLRYSNGGSAAEPLAAHQWDMRMIHATPEGSYRREKGDKKVLVGIADTGVDGNHPDIKANFSRSLSRNFTVDSPDVDGPCAAEPDGSCNDPNDVDENSHGTHVASTIASPINGIGMSGVAPNVTIVNIRAGQDSGFFFLQPSVDALTYAGDIGIDVVNMSYFIDPWLYNCRGLADDSPAEQIQQATIIEATQRALDYAHTRGVTLVGAAGNSLTDLTMPKPVIDNQSPNYPLGTNHPRTVNNGCLDLPTEGNNVISVSSVGPSKIKADYSNYGYGEISVAAPGGWSRDEPWNLSMTPAERTAASIPNLILAAYPKNVAEEAGDLNPDGTPNNGFVVRSCKGTTCAYYQWIQGTSMAAPHASGVAALIVSKYGENRRGGKTMHPKFTQAYLEASATDTPCMTPNPFTYTHKGRSAAYTTWCEGTPVYNGVYGNGIVDALNAVTFGGGGSKDDD
jgi:subtilisin family serine protease